MVKPGALPNCTLAKINEFKETPRVQTRLKVARNNHNYTIKGVGRFSGESLETGYNDKLV